MSTGALTMMLVTEITITVITGYFFYKVLTMKKHDEPDSYTENDDKK
ncbi:MAG: hypothetical protein HYZ14_08040 [Bacteroidetes bacterium]|nr:hypothetical protein [Bacteroidota bacterium]